MWPAASRPTMALPAQQAAVMQSRRKGWLAIQSPDDVVCDDVVWSDAAISGYH